jgi:GST-like protein
VIDLYFWPTPSGYKNTILLEGLGWSYNVPPVHIGKGEPAFAAISPNNKIPALVDHDGPDGEPIALFESGEIMLYLAEKAGWPFLPSALRQRFATVQWLMFQMAHVGPMLGQLHRFRGYGPEPIPYAVDRYTREARWIDDLLNRRLEAGPWLAADYSLADMAVFPWIRPRRWQGQTSTSFPACAAGRTPSLRARRCSAAWRSCATGWSTTGRSRPGAPGRSCSTTRQPTPREQRPCLRTCPCSADTACSTSRSSSLARPVRACSPRWAPRSSSWSWARTAIAAAAPD